MGYQRRLWLHPARERQREGGGKREREVQKKEGTERGRERNFKTSHRGRQLLLLDNKKNLHQPDALE